MLLLHQVNELPLTYRTHLVIDFARPRAELEHSAQPAPLLHWLRGSSFYLRFIYLFILISKTGISALSAQFPGFLSKIEMPPGHRLLEESTLNPAVDSATRFPLVSSIFPPSYMRDLPWPY